MRKESFLLLCLVIMPSIMSKKYIIEWIYTLLHKIIGHPKTLKTSNAFIHASKKAQPMNCLQESDLKLADTSPLCLSLTSPIPPCKVGMWVHVSYGGETFPGHIANNAVHETEVSCMVTSGKSSSYLLLLSGTFCAVLKLWIQLAAMLCLTVSTSVIKMLG